MAITAYTGLPGSGKSYGVVRDVVLPALKKGRRVTTNIPLNMELIDSEFPGLVTLFDTKQILADPDWFQTHFDKGATLVIDECWRLWSSGLRANNMHEGHKSFLAEHRHMVGEDGFSTEIVFVTQGLDQLAAYPRNLVETTYRSVKLTAIGSSKKFRIDVYEGPVTGPSPPKDKRLRQLFGEYQPDVYKYYQSQTMSDAASHGDESSTDGKNNILKSPFFRVFLPVLLLAGVYVIYLGWSAIRSIYNEDEQQAASGTEQLPPHVIEDQSGLPKPLSKPKHRHFYNGMDAYIAWNLGRNPFIEYRIAFTKGDQRVVLGQAELGKLGYRIVGYDQCFAQLKGHGSTLNLYCETQKDEEDNSFIEL